MTLDIKSFGLKLLKNITDTGQTKTYTIIFPHECSTAHLYKPHIEYFEMLTYDNNRHFKEMLNKRSKSPFNVCDVCLCKHTCACVVCL